MVSNFKKSNINNSELMQNLVKIALEKGIIKNKEAAPIKKEASVNLNPTEDLKSNILVLKAALEQKKLYKEAKELEESFLFYIKAENALYDLNNDFTLSEMNKVHPGKETIDVAGDNVVENLEEEHDAIMKAVANLHKKKDLNKVAKLIKQSQGYSILSLIDTFKNSPNGFKLFVDAVKSQVGNLSKAEIALLRKQYLERVAGKVLETAGKSVGTEAAAIGAGETAAATGVAETAAAVAGIGIGTVAASIAISALVGGFIGSELFKSDFYAENILEAGNNIIATGQKLFYSDQLHSKSTENFINFKKYFEIFKASISTVSEVTEETKAIDALKIYKKHSNNLQNCINTANSLMMFARNQFNEYDPRQILPGFVSTVAQFKNLEIVCGNFINVATKVDTSITMTINSILDALKKINDQKEEQEFIKANPKKNINEINVQQSFLVEQNLDNLANYKQILNTNSGNVYKPEEIKTGLEWLNDQSQEFREIQKVLSQNKTVSSNMVANIKNLDNQVKDFYNKWIK